MKRDPDLIRALLIEIENGRTNLNVHECNEIPLLAEFDPNLIHYNMSLLNDAGLIEASATHSGSWWVKTISWAGHDFLDAVRDVQIWAQVKRKVAKVGSAPFDVIKGVASNLISVAITG